MLSGLSPQGRADDRRGLHVLRGGLWGALDNAKPSNETHVRLGCRSGVPMAMTKETDPVNRDFLSNQE